MCGSPVRAMNNNDTRLTLASGRPAGARRDVALADPNCGWTSRYRDDGKAAEAAAEAEALRAQLDSYSAQAATLSPATLAKVEANLLPKIKDAERRSRIDTGSPLVAELAGPNARGRWDSLTVPQRREIVRALVRVRVLAIGKGARFKPESVEVSPVARIPLRGLLRSRLPNLRSGRVGPSGGPTRVFWMRCTQ